METNHETYDLVEDRDLIIEEFEKTIAGRFKSEEAEGITFTLGLYITDVDAGMIASVEDGSLNMLKDKKKNEIEEADVYVFCDLNIFEKIDSSEMVIPDLHTMDDESIVFGGDIGLVYELYNIFDFPV